ncbi:hypothetical protein ZWY2020_032922 [Hordeum vulgare]|nr:hypothetical protein ZWY2020_032922 [Hordeum vulgare]
MGMLLARVAVSVLAVATAVVVVVDGQMSPAFYDATCPGLQSVVRRGMAQAVQKEARMGASILRLFVHDCFVNSGACMRRVRRSVLLDDTANFTGRRTRAERQPLRGYEVIDAIKAQVEAACRATVSCADILALAARDGVNLLGGPSWTVQLGRRDGRSATQNAANTNLPPPDARLADLLTRFSDKGLTRLRAPSAFDNGYFQDLVARRVLLRSDQELYGSGAGNGSTDAIVRAYAANATMGNLALTGKNGEVRLNCRRVN